MDQQNSHLAQNVLSHHFGKITKVVLAVQTVVKADWRSLSCSVHEEGIPARYYQANQMPKPNKYNSRLLSGLCCSPLGQNSTVGAAQRCFNQCGPVDKKWLEYLTKPEEQMKGLRDEKIITFVDKQKFFCKPEDAEDIECEMEENWHIHDIYSQTISAGNQTPVANNKNED